MTRTLMALWAALLPTTALASDDDSPYTLFSLNVGTFGLVASEDGWKGQYIYYGPSLNIPIGRHAMVMPSIAFESAPETGAWGIAGTCTVEMLISKHFGIDIVPSVIQDTVHGETSIILAFGPGVTYISPHHVGVGIIVQGGYLLGEDRLAFLPSLNVSVPIP